MLGGGGAGEGRGGRDFREARLKGQCKKKNRVRREERNGER